MTGSTSQHQLAHRPAAGDHTAAAFFAHSSARRVCTDTVIVEALRKQYPELKLTVAPSSACNLLGFASSGHATLTPIGDPDDSPAAGYSASLKWRQYLPPARRMDKSPGALVDKVQFGKYIYRYKKNEFILYIVDGRDGTMSYPEVTNNYILTSTEQHVVDELIMAASQWTIELHNEVWVYNDGYWQKSAELFESARKASWNEVILDPEMKQTLRDDVNSFFDGQDTYNKLKVPWKRGVIYYGPPGNGKTISIKAIMHELYSRDEPIPTLYVRSLVNFMGPERAISDIFSKARSEAPCLLVLEDLDSIISDSVRSFFLNEVDGLKSNDGILMVGSTNHLDRLDPGLSKRPSRFDRKYLFPDPNLEERTQYCHFWQRKLADNSEIEFPDKLCEAIARITDKFSFAYIQEAFVAALLKIAAGDSKSYGMRCRGCRNRVDASGFCQRCKYHCATYWPDADDKDGELAKYILWRVIKKQVKILRDEMDNSDS